MFKVDYAKVCIKLREKFGDNFIERVERRMGMDFEVALSQKPTELLVSMLEDLYLYYVLPYEQILEISEYLASVYDIREFSLAFSEREVLPVSEHLKDVEDYVRSFYTMVESLGFRDRFVRKKEKWWKP